jgi:DNA-binding NtrC family response regulator
MPATPVRPRPLRFDTERRNKAMHRTIVKSTVPQMAPKVFGTDVLLVDDNATDLEYHYDLLQSQGHKSVVTCSSYEEGATLLGRDDFDLVVVSQGSPAFEGRVVVERTLSAGRHIPVVVLASDADMKCYLEAMELGAVDYLQKPVSAAEMRRVVAACLNGADKTQTETRRTM